MKVTIETRQTKVDRGVFKSKIVPGPRRVVLSIEFTEEERYLIKQLDPSHRIFYVNEGMWALRMNEYSKKPGSHFATISDLFHPLTWGIFPRGHGSDEEKDDPVGVGRLRNELEEACRKLKSTLETIKTAPAKKTLEL